MAVAGANSRSQNDNVHVAAGCPTRPGTARIPTDQIAQELQDVLGQKLTAFIAGAKDPKATGKWVQGRQPHPNAEQRLRAAHQILEVLLEVDSPQTARVWFVGMNPHLGDDSPAEAIRDGHLKAAITAARTFANT